MTSELCVPKKCIECHGRVDIGIVEVTGKDGKKLLGPVSQFIVSQKRRRKDSKILRTEFTFSRWHFYCWEHYDSWMKNCRESGGDK